MDLSIREWTCPHCSTHHAPHSGSLRDRDTAASRNIRAEGIRMLRTDGIAVPASGGDVRPNRGRKTKTRQSPVKLETTCSMKR